MWYAQIVYCFVFLVLDHLQTSPSFGPFHPIKLSTKPSRQRQNIRRSQPASDPGPFREDEQGYTTEEIPGEVLEKLCHSLRWSTTTRKATEEACLPTPKVNIEGFHVTSRQTNFSCRNTYGRHVGFLYARPSMGKRNKMSPRLLQKTTVYWKVKW